METDDFHLVVTSEVEKEELIISFGKYAYNICAPINGLGEIIFFDDHAPGQAS